MVDQHESTPSDIDSPLTKSAEDALGRTPYAEHVADMIAGWRGEHSAVFAIYGEWGSGKTSFKNFILEKLKSDPESNQPLIVEFNPWEWEGPRQVTEAFFARLVEEIGDKAPNGADVSQRLSRYATYFTLGASIADSAATVLPWLVPAGGNLATLLSKFLKDAGAQAKIASEAKPEQQSLSRLRADVVESIRSIKRTVLVTIDDVDRLTTAETAILFQLLKANANFPNVVYLILCDREVVARNLEKVVADHGDDYLEKIVQLGLPLPKAYPDQLRSALLAGLQTELRNAGVERLIDNNRLFNLYDEHAAPFFRTMRDVKRFLAGISAVLPAVTRDGHSTVDLVDFIGIELLRTFDHEFYEAIYCYRARISQESLPSEDKELVKKLAGERDQDGPTLGVFGELFTRFGPARTVARRPRIGHPRTFDRYFLFAVPPDQYSPAEENDVLARRGRPQFVKELESARERGRLQYLLELLDSAEPPHEQETAINYLSALATFADTLHLNDGADEKDSYRDQVERLAFACLRPHDPARRADLLVTACERTNAVWFPVTFETHFRKTAPDKLTDDGKDRLKELGIQRLRSSGDAVRSHPAAGDLLLWWLENGDGDRAKAVAEKMVSDTEFLFDFIHGFSHLDLANIRKPRRRVSGFRTFARKMNRLIPIEKILARVSEIEQDSLTSRQRALIRALRDDAQRMAAADADAAAEANARDAALAEAEGAPGQDSDDHA